LVKTVGSDGCGSVGGFDVEGCLDVFEGFRAVGLIEFCGSAGSGEVEALGADLGFGSRDHELLEAIGTEVLGEFTPVEVGCLVEQAVAGRVVGGALGAGFEATLEGNVGGDGARVQPVASGFGSQWVGSRPVWWLVEGFGE
jgi:hypothetical protein